MASKLTKRNQFWESVDVWSSPVVANMLWLVLSMLVITMPLGFVGLFAMMFHWTDSRSTQVFSIFFGTMRRVWLKAYLLFALDLTILAFLALNLFIFQLMDMNSLIAFLSRSATILTALIFIAVNIPAWLLLATWDAPLKRILGFSLRLVFAEPLWMFLLVLAFVAPFIFSLYLPAVILVFFTGAVAAYIACKGTFRLIYKYMARADLRVIEIS